MKKENYDLYSFENLNDIIKDRKCGYRNCDKQLDGRKDNVKFCCSNHRKYEQKALNKDKVVINTGRKEIEVISEDEFFNNERVCGFKDCNERLWGMKSNAKFCCEQCRKNEFNRKEREFKSFL